MDPQAILVFVAVGVCSPVLAYCAHLLIDRHRTRKAQEFLEADPLVFEGAKFVKLLTAAGAQLMGPGRIAEIESGRVLAVSSDDAVRVPFDAVEFKSMYPHWLDAGPDPAGPGGGLPGPRPQPREENYS